MCVVFSAGESGRTGEVSRIVEAGRSTEEKTPRPERRGRSLSVDVGVWIANMFVCLLACRWRTLLEPDFPIRMGVDDDRIAGVVDVDEIMFYLLLLCI